MRTTFAASIASIFLITSVNARPATRSDSPERLRSRALLGSNFGIPTFNATFNYVIVGGGNAGLTLAARLTEDPSVSVAVVEAGSFYEISTGNTSEIPSDDIFWTGKSPSDVNPLVDWGFTTTPQAGVGDQVVHYARGKCLGGSTARNYMAYQRSTIDAYQMWADEVDDPSYTFENFLPYFQKSLNFTPPDNTKRGANATPEYDASSLGTGQPLDVTFPNYAQPFSTWVQKALQQVGVEPIDGFTSGRLLGSSWDITTINHTTGARESSETAFLQPALGRPNLLIYDQTLATKIAFDGKNATGVAVSTEGYPYFLTASDEVIVSAGAFQSPQLLMVSGIGPAATLQQYDIEVVADLPGVGQNMWDHVLFGTDYRVDVTTDSIIGNPELYAEAIDLFHTEQDGFLSNPGGDFLAWEKLPQPYRSNLSSATQAQLATFPADWPEIEYLPVGAYFGNAEDLLTGSPTDGYNYATLAVALIAPLSRGNISINSSSTADQPLINPAWLTAEADRELAVQTFRRVREVAATPALSSIIIGPEYYPGPSVQTDAEILEYIENNFSLLYHAAGTCKMGAANDTLAVVDSHARVYGVEKLRVVDAAAFPFLPAGHPMSTVYALAEKIADDIKNRQ